MTIEAGVVIDLDNQPLFWHLPNDRTGGSLPDSKSLWDVLWDNRDKISGFAHSHPGSGIPGPSYTDVTTFAAIESALGKRLIWPIITSDSYAVFKWNGPGKYDYKIYLGLAYESPQEPNFTPNPPWVAELRKHSNFANPTITEDIRNAALEQFEITYKENEDGKYHAGQ